jgi:hypothetical protein
MNARLIDLDEALAAPRFNCVENGSGGHGPQRHLPIIGRASELRTLTFDPIRYVVPGYIAEGCTILAGKPKLGKSWLCLEAGLAVASGTTCLGGILCQKGSVLFLALEDNRRRLQRRMDKVLSPFGGEWPEAFEYATEWPRADEGGIEHIREWIEGTPDARLIVVDVLAMFRPARGNQQSLYEADYAAVSGLQGLASRYGIAVVIVHHVRKSPAETDPFEKVSGTMGLTGAADTVLVLDRDSNGVTLYGRGRDIEEIETAVTFDKDSCRWIVMGAASEVHRSDERSAIVTALCDSPEPMSPREVSDAAGLPYGNVRQLLVRMHKAGEVEKVKRGLYRLSRTPCHNDHNVTSGGSHDCPL